MAQTDLTTLLKRLTADRTRIRGARDSLRNLERKLSTTPDWHDLTPVAKQRRLTEAREQLRAGLRTDVEAMRATVGAITGDAAERLSVETYFRNARFCEDDATLEELTRIRHALELPRTPDAALNAMVHDCVARGGDAAAALLTLIRREAKHRTDASVELKSALITAENHFPLPQQLAADRALVVEIAEAADGIESAWAEIASGASHTDVSDRVEHYRNGGAPPEASPRESRRLPASLILADPQPNDAA